MLKEFNYFNTMGSNCQRMLGYQCEIRNLGRGGGYLSEGNTDGLTEQTVGSWVAFDTHQPIKHKQPLKS